MAWYTAAGGTTCVAAYNAVGAASLSNSYVNLANPGTNDLTVGGSAPTWSYGTGWTFTSSKYLITGVVPASGYSILVRFSAGTFSGAQRICGAKNTDSNPRFEIIPNFGGASYYFAGSNTSPSGGLSSGVTGIAGQQGYKNGSAHGGTIGAWSGSITYGIHINGTNNGGSNSSATVDAVIQAVAIYSGTLSGADVATITTAMLALPTASLLPVMFQHSEAGMI